MYNDDDDDRRVFPAGRCIIILLRDAYDDDGVDGRKKQTPSENDPFYPRSYRNNMYATLLLLLCATG